MPDLTSDPAETGAELTGAWEAPANSWSVAVPPAGLVAQGFEIGNVPPDFRLLDQFGQEVALWQFYGSVVVLDISTMWCAPCQELALEAQATADDFDGLIYLTVLAEDTDGGTPEIEEVALWADTFGLRQPVVGDPEAAWSSPAVLDGSFPVVLVVDRDLKVAVKVGTLTDAGVRAAIEEVW